MYSQIPGPYNRKNVFGAIFSFGAFFTDKNMITIRQQVLEACICKGLLIDWFNKINGDCVKHGYVNFTVETRGMQDEHWLMNINC